MTAARLTTPLRRTAVLVAALLLALVAAGSAAPRPAEGAAGLPRLNVVDNYVTGISSGGYMATQLQVAHSSRFEGAGVFSAGTYWCARGSLVVALESCTAYNVPTDMSAVYAETERYARDGLIDPLQGLTTSRTWFFHGEKDPTVLRPVADHLAAFYRHYGTPLTYRDTTAAGHGWISPLGPVACAATAAPFINACPPYDAQADLLRTLRGSVKAPAAIGMGRTGYLYTPPSCARGAKCDVVVALHGCKQTADQIGTTFVERSGLNTYADTNSFAVLYPQAAPDASFGNPNGCWDWWGYLGPGDADYATKRGPQMVTVMAMVSALGG